jgi:hypothetical protein
MVTPLLRRLISVAGAYLKLLQSDAARSNKEWQWRREPADQA